MDLFVCSLNHRVTPFEGLEKMLDPPIQDRIRRWIPGDLLESALLSTCSRLEIYGVGDATSFAVAFTDFLRRVEDPIRLPFQVEVGVEAARHLAGVAAGMDSILWGETAITHQVRSAYRQASDQGQCGPWLHRLFHTVLRGSRRIRRGGPVEAVHRTLSSAAAHAVVAGWEDLTDRSVVVLGAGTAGSAALRALRTLGVGRLALVSSREEAAVASELGARLHSSSELVPALAQADGAIAASSRGRLLDAAMLLSIARGRLREGKGSALRLIDLGMPRNVDPSLVDPGVELLDLRDLASRTRGPSPHPERVRDLVVAEYESWRLSRLATSREAPSPRPARSSASATPPGRVYLVGAGPGDPELLTVKAERVLAAADIVFHDALITDEILERIPPGVRRVPVGRRKGRTICEQDQVHRGMASWAIRGATVVRLKGGDPMVFGRGGEEIEAMERAGVPVEVVPGVTAAIAAAASARVGLTHRGHAATCALLTLHQAGEGTHAGSPSWETIRSLAKSADTLAVYMGATRVAALARELLDAGRPPEESLAVIERAQQPDCRIHWYSLMEACDLAAEFERPAMVLVGPSVSVRHHREEEIDCTKTSRLRTARSRAGPGESPVRRSKEVGSLPPSLIDSTR